MILVLFVMFYIKPSLITDFSQISNIFFCDILEHKFLRQEKKSININFWSRETSADTQFMVPQHSDNWKTYQHQGSANCCEVDLDSDLNRLASGNLRQYTTVSSQCEQLLWTWTWIIMYFDPWSHFKKRLGIVKFVTRNQLSLQ